jgi:hypothetical protein
MKQEFEMTQEEMDNIIAINKGGGDPIMFLSGGIPMGSSLQEKINQYWKILGNKYGFKPMTVEGSSKGKLFFIAEPVPIENEMRKYIDTFKGRMLKENVEVNQQKSIQHIINNEIVDRFDTGNVSITTAIEAVKIAYQEIIDMIELNFETAGELGGGTTEAQSIINRIEEFKKRAKENF